MKTFNNQGIIIKALKKSHEKRDAEPCDILNAPGMCNGMLNLFHRKVIKRMNQRNALFTLEIAREAAQKLTTIYHAILDNDEEASKRVDQLRYFQSPQKSQPGVMMDDLAAINKNYNQKRYPHKNSDFFENVSLCQDFAGCVSKKELQGLLSYYLPFHPNQIIRVATPIHVIGISYHVDENNQIAFSIFDPNYDINNPLRILEAQDLESGIKELIATLQDSFYEDDSSFSFEEFDDRFTLSLKFYSFKDSVKTSEKNGATYLMDLLAEDDLKVERPDSLGYDSLFVSAEYGHLETVRALLNEYGNTKLKYSFKQEQGKKYKCSPMKVSEDHGHKAITQLLQK